VIYQKDSSTIETGNARVYKYNVSNARRILGTMTDSRTPRETRRALRESLLRMVAYTDMRRREISSPGKVAALLHVAVLHRSGETWAQLHAELAILWRTFNDYDREANPRRWLRFDGIMREYAERCRRDGERPVLLATCSSLPEDLRAVAAEALKPRRPRAIRAERSAHMTITETWRELAAA
jgi:hypothetical protein